MDDLYPHTIDPQAAPEPEVEPAPEMFVSDYRFASDEDIRAVTVNHLAKLEAELHTLRMAYIANGKNADALLAPKRPIGGEMVRIKHSIEALSEYFANVLTDPTNQ